MTGRPAAAGRTPQPLELLRRSNVAAVLGAIRDRGAASRSEVAGALGLSPAVLTGIVADLERAGLVVEGERSSPTGGRGRPGRPVCLDLSRFRFVGVHVGVGRVTVGLVDLAGTVLRVRSRAHSSTRPEAVLGRAAGLVRTLLDASGTPPADVLGIGAGVGGWVSRADGLVREFDELGWRDVRSARLGVDGLPPPVLESSVRALATAEARRTGSGDVLYLFVGNVVGAAHVVGGAIDRGRHDAAGMIDHLATPFRAARPCTCGRRDCLWAVASDTAVDLADDRALRRRATRVGTVLADLVRMHDPERVVVGGGELATDAGHFDTMAESCRARLRGHPVEIEPAALTGPPGLVLGAATPAMDEFYADPLAARR